MTKETALKILRDLHNKALFSERTALETFIPELAETDDERIRKFITHELACLRASEEKGSDRYKELTTAIYWLEKQGKQKPTDKVQPTFKVGDWVVNNTTFNLCHILKVEHGQYICDDCSFPITKKNEYHLWSIQDAKDGDVLVCENGWTCIFKALVNDETFSSYCFMDKTKWFCETGSEGHTLKEEFVKAYGGEIYPATKEQRALFFAKMKEAGYEWDSERKELVWKKIEQKCPDAPSENDWVDLGLPSGTLWKSSNETGLINDFYTHDEAMQKFGDQLPTKEQFKELKDLCKWTWAGNGYNVTGVNGNSIFLPAAGYSDDTGNEYYVEKYGSYWSSIPSGELYAWSLEFNTSWVGMSGEPRGLCQSVRLINSTVH